MGELRSASQKNGQPAKIRNALRFQGQYCDDETGLHYNLNRYYDPASGRFINEDPIGLRSDLNLYTYSINNPINLVDPLGLYVWIVLGTCLTVGGIGYSLYKFMSNSKKAGDSCKKAGDMRNEQLQWVADGAIGSPPYTENQVQNEAQTCLRDSGQAAIAGAGLEAKPVTATGSFSKNILKWFGK